VLGPVIREPPVAPRGPSTASAVAVVTRVSQTLTGPYTDPLSPVPAGSAVLPGIARPRRGFVGLDLASHPRFRPCNPTVTEVYGWCHLNPAEYGE
jgi:hypothetical protein